MKKMNHYLLLVNDLGVLFDGPVGLDANLLAGLLVVEDQGELRADGQAAAPQGLAAPRGLPPAVLGEAPGPHPGAPRELPLAEEVDGPGLLVRLVPLCSIDSDSYHDS